MRGVAKAQNLLTGCNQGAGNRRYVSTYTGLRLIAEGLFVRLLATTVNENYFGGNSRSEFGGRGLGSGVLIVFFTRFPAANIRKTWYLLGLTITFSFHVKHQSGICGVYVGPNVSCKYLTLCFSSPCPLTFSFFFSNPERERR